MIRSAFVLLMLLHALGSFCQTNSTDKKDTLKEFSVVEVMPEFPGGETALMQWLVEKITYLKADSACIPIKIFISFTIDTTGAVINPDIKTTSTFPVDCIISDSYEKSVASEILKMPLWIPGKQNGKPVRVRYKVPIAFDWK